MPFDQVNFVLPAVETDAVLRNLVAARALIDTPDRWCKDDLYRDGARCVLGAIHGTDADKRDNPVGDYIGSWRILTDLTRDIVSFNNAPATTHADVLDLFDRAIAARRAAIASKDR